MTKVPTRTPALLDQGHRLASGDLNDPFEDPPHGGRQSETLGLRRQHLTASLTSTSPPAVPCRGQRGGGSVSQSATERSRVAAPAWRRPGHWCPRPSDCPPCPVPAPSLWGRGRASCVQPPTAEAALHARGVGAGKPGRGGAWRASPRQGTLSPCLCGHFTNGARGASHGQRRLLRGPARLRTRLGGAGTAARP